VPTESFDVMLTGGHPNSLGRTVEVVDAVLADPDRLDELYACYTSADEVVRLRTSNALKRICSRRPELLVPYVDRLISEVAAVPQPSAQWTLSQIFGMLGDRLSPAQRAGALRVMKRNLDENHDWIVQNQTMQTLAEWATTDEELKAWVRPRIDARVRDARRSIAKRAVKLRRSLDDG